MKGIIVNIRNGKKQKSKNALIAMLEELVFGKDAVEKKRILVDEYLQKMDREFKLIIPKCQVICYNINLYQTLCRGRDLCVY